MAAFKKRSTRRKPATKKAFVKKAVTKAKTQRLTKFIKRVVARTEEVKHGSDTNIIGLSAYTNTTNLPNMIIPVTPYAVSGISISQGTGQTDRIGNKIRTKSSWLRGCIYPRVYNATTNPQPQPQEVRVWFFSAKNTNNQLTTLPNFLQNGNSSGAPVGTILDMTRMVNSDVYIYRGHRTFKVGFSNYGGTGAQLGSQTFNNNDFKYNVKFNINLTKMMPKVIQYNDSDDTPFSRSVFMYWETVDADGQSQAATEIQLEMSYTHSFDYTDV